VCTPKIKGWKTLLKLNPTPCKKRKQLTQNQGAQSKRGFAPLIEQKNQRIWGFFGEIGVRVGWGQNGKFGDLGGRR
jgi:hypothetical protein